MNETELSVAKSLLTRITNCSEKGEASLLNAEIENYDTFLRCVERRLSIDLMQRFPNGLTATGVASAEAR